MKHQSFVLLTALLLIPACSVKKSGKSSAPGTELPQEVIQLLDETESTEKEIEKEKEKEKESEAVTKQPPVLPEVSVPAYDASLGPETESLDIDLSRFTADKKLKLIASYHMNEFSARGAILSPLKWPALTIKCGDEQKVKAIGFVLSPIKDLRLSAQADLVGCATARIEYPKNAPGFYFNPESARLSWRLERDSEEKGQEVFVDQLEKSSILVKEGQGNAKDKIVFATKDLFPTVLEGETPKYHLFAARELSNYVPTSSILSHLNWPKLEVKCDGTLLDETKFIVMKNNITSTLRLAVKADVTGCQTIDLGSDRAHRDGSYEDTSLITWTLIQSNP